MVRLLLIWLLRAYRFAISPLYGQVCRYHPSCSAYALGAVETHGALRGSWLAVRRLSHCHPWSDGGYDPVPPRKADRRSTRSAPDDRTTSPAASPHSAPAQPASP